MSEQVLNSGDIEALIERFAGSDLLAKGCVHVISWELIRETMGGRWEAKKDTVWEFVERHFRQDFQPADTILRVNSEVCLIAQPAETALGAEGRALNLLRTVLAFFLGPSAVPNLTVMRVSRIGPNGIEQEPVSGTSSPSTPPKAAPAEASAPSFEPVAEQSPFGAPTLTRIPGLPLIEILPFAEPIWSIKTRAVVSYRLRRAVFTEDDQGGLVPFELTTAPVRDLIRIDAGTVEEATRLLQKQPPRQRIVLHIPVHEQTLSSTRGRQLVVQRLSAHKAIAKQWIIVSLCGLSPGTPQGRVIEAVSFLGSLCRGVVAQAPSLDFDILRWQGAQVSAVALDLSELDAPPKALQTGLYAFAGRAKAMPTIAYSIATRPALMAAWSAGFTHVGGDAISPRLSSTPIPIRFEPADLYPEVSP